MTIAQILFLNRTSSNNISSLTIELNLDSRQANSDLEVDQKHSFHVALIYSESNTIFCSGSLISKDHVLTAEICIR